MGRKVDNSLRITTVLAVIVVIASIIYSYDHYSLNIWMVMAIMALLFFPILYIPYKVAETPDSYTLTRLIGKKVYKKAEYIEKCISLNDKGFILRIFGTSMWVYWGYFWNKKIGLYFGSHLCSDHVLLLIDKNGKKIVIDNPKY